MEGWDDIEPVPDREQSLRALLGAVIASSMVPITEREVLEEACRLLDDAWADFERFELRDVLRGNAEMPGAVMTPTGFFAALSPPTDISAVFARAAESEALAARIAESQGPSGGDSWPAQILFAAPLLSTDGERRLGLKAQQGDRIAINALILSNTRLAAALARRKQTYPALDGEDLLQEAILGLLRAAEKFDPSKGFKFSTYATWWVRQAISRAVADKSRTVRVPVHIVEKLNQLRGIEYRYHKAGRPNDPTNDEVAAELGWSLFEVANYRQSEILPEELDTYAELEDRTALGVEDEVLAAIEVDELRAFLEASLSYREMQVLIRRRGLFETRKETLDEIGKTFRVTRERIRQIENIAIKRLLESDYARARRTTASALSTCAVNTPMLKHPANIPRELAVPPSAAADAASDVPEPDETPLAEGKHSVSTADGSSPHPPRQADNVDREQADTPAQRALDRAAAEHATMLLSDADTGRPELILGRRDIELLREALAAVGKHARDHLENDGNVKALRGIARGNVEASSGQADMLDLLGQAVTMLAERQDSSPSHTDKFNARVVAAMLHGTVVETRS
jgi:RNA polymerase primary sigma factor